MELIEVINEKIDMEKILTFLSNPSSGATSIFIGTTRNNFEGKEVFRLDYEAYKPMAIKEMSKICSTMRSMWPLMNIVLVHRIGTVPVGEASVVIAATSAHRKEAQQSVMFGIDAVKETVPIWKKEQYTDGTCNWKENCECKWKR